MQYAHEIMDRSPLTVAQDLEVGELAQWLLETRADGAIVVDGRTVLGVVTAMDLVFQEKRVQLPTLVAFMDAVLPLGTRRTEAELAKITGATVGEIMTTPAVTVPFDTPLGRIATQMVEQHHTLVPVTQGGVLVGVIDKRAVLSAVFGARS